MSETGEGSSDESKDIFCCNKYHSVAIFPSKIKIKAHKLKTVTCIPKNKTASVEARSYSVAMICGLLQSHTQTGPISIGVNYILQRLIAYLY